MSLPTIRIHLGSIDPCKSCRNYAFKSRRHTFVIAIRRTGSDDSLPEGGAQCPSDFIIYSPKVGGTWTLKIEKTRLGFLDQLHVGFKLEETLFRWFHLSGLAIPNMIDPIRIITDYIDAIAVRFFEPIIHR